MSYQPPNQPPYPPPQPPKKSRRRLWIILSIIVGVLVFSCIICNIAIANTPQAAQPTPTPSPTAVAAIATATTAPTQAPTATATSKPTPTPKPTNAPKTLDQQINDLVQGSGMSGKNIKSMYNVGGDNYEKIEEDIGDGNLTNSLTVGQIQNDCFNVQKALWTQAASHLSEVEVVVTMNVVDQYGNTSNQMVGNFDLKSDTAKLFNWDNLTFDQAWKNYDSTFIAPFLTS